MDFRDDVLALLGAYEPTDEGEKKAKETILRFVADSEELGRTNASGHITGSAFVVNASRTEALLNHHAKLDKWMQFGGHAEACDERVADTAMREAVEESGLRRLAFASKDVFDLDVHLIPERQGVAAHYHYDLRFLLVADSSERPEVSEESKSVRWVPISKIEEYTRSESMLRMKRKVEANGRR